MPVTIKNNPEDAGGVNNCIVITIPARGETGWADLVRAAFKKISQHDHTGNENGAQLGVASLQDGAVTKAKINANVAGEGLTKDVTSGALNVKIDDVTIEREAPTNTLRLKDDGVSAAKLNADVAGLGLVQNGVDESLEVNVDDSTIEIDSDVVRVKDLGIVTAKLADAAITTVKLLNSSVTTDKIADDAVTAAKIPFISDTVATDAVQNDTLVWNATTGQFEPEAGGGGGGASGINHIEESDAESTLATWSASFSSDFNVTADTSNILRGLKSFKLRKAAKVVASPYVEVSFSIPNADKAKKHLISFDYDASDVNYSDDDIRLSIIQGASTEIRINGEDLKGGKGTHFATFQTDHTETAYKLRFTYRNTTDANLVDVFLDTVKVSPIGVTEAVGTQFVGCKATVLSNYNVTGNGDHRLEFNNILFDSHNSFDSTTHLYTVPETGYYQISALIAAVNADGFFEARIQLNLGSKYYGGAEADNTNRLLLPLNTTEYLEKGTTVAIVINPRDNTGDDADYDIDGGTLARTEFSVIKIQEIALPETVGSGRDIVVNAKMALPPSYHTTNNGWETVPFQNVDVDTVGGWDATNNRYTIPETGYYDITGAVRTATSTGVGLIAISIDGTVAFPSNDSDVTAYTNTAQGFDITFTAFYLQKGQTVEIKFLQSTGGNLQYGQTGTYFQLAKRQSAQVALDSGRDAVLHVSTETAQELTSGDNIFLSWDRTRFNTDTTNSFDGTHYTVPESGYYDINAIVTIAAQESTDETKQFDDLESFQIKLRHSVEGYFLYDLGTQARVNDDLKYNYVAKLSTTRYLEKGVTITVIGFQNSGVSQYISTNGAFNQLSIAKRK